MRFRLKEVPLVSLSSIRSTRNRQPQFEGHVKPWRRWWISVESYARQIVKRVRAFLDQSNYPIESALASRYFYCRARSEAKAARSRNEGYQQRLITVVVRHIEKDVGFSAGQFLRQMWMCTRSG